MAYLRPLYDFVTKELSKEWIDVPKDTRVNLPDDHNLVNRTANVNLPINREQLRETTEKMRLHYNFTKIPDLWIKDSYEGKTPLPELDSLANDLAKKTTDIVVLPIIDANMIKSTVAKLHQYYNFDKLPKHFFRTTAFKNPLFNYSESALSL